ncbi:hypothetical protein [Sinorhizobium meliloti]|uniref:hypothetical protein n=1 Tax=Rhizobium meliloti TaxID=382 RepID=UPI001F2076C3|nr:hypothetical protein [Sinorhizobium meliloti]
MDLVIDTCMDRDIDLSRTDADCAITLINEPLAGYACERLLQDAVLAVCAPDFARQHRLNGAPHRLRDVAILHDIREEPGMD